MARTFHRAETLFQKLIGESTIFPPFSYDPFSIGVTSTLSPDEISRGGDIALPIRVFLNVPKPRLGRDVRKIRGRTGPIASVIEYFTRRFQRWKLASNDLTGLDVVGGGGGGKKSDESVPRG